MRGEKSSSGTRKEALGDELDYIDIDGITERFELLNT